MLCFQAVDFGIGQFAVTGRDRILPDEIFLRYIGAEVGLFGPISRWVSLNQARAKVSSNAAGSWRNFSEIFLYSGSIFIAISASVMMGLRRTPGICASKGFSSSGILTGSHWIGTCRALPHFPIIIEQQVEIGMVPFVGSTGPRTFQSAGHRVLLHCRFLSILPSETLVLYFWRPQGIGPRADASPLPCALPTVCPPAVSATVSSSFIPMRLKVVRTS